MLGKETNLLKGCLCHRVFMNEQIIALLFDLSAHNEKAKMQMRDQFVQRASIQPREKRGEDIPEHLRQRSIICNVILQAMENATVTSVNWPTLAERAERRREAKLT
jgi:hypothetical protein